MRVPLESVNFYVKVPKAGGKIVEVTVGLRKGYDKVPNKGHINLFQNLVMLYTKR
jgi:hypothetical protein